MSRKELVEEIMWNDGGYGFRGGGIVASMAWAMDAPSASKPDLKSVVAVSGPPRKYGTDELRKLATFARQRTAAYDKMFRYRRGANLVLFDKVDSDTWMRKALSWESGPMFSATLDHAIAFMAKSRDDVPMPKDVLEREVAALVRKGWSHDDIVDRLGDEYKEAVGEKFSG